MNLHEKEQALQAQLDAATNAVPLAFRQNFDPEWFARFSRIGVDVVMVHFARTAGNELHSHPELAESLGRELEEARVGRFDSSHYNGGHQFHLFHIFDLGKALAMIKRQLEIRSLLGLSWVLHRETASAWRCMWSPVPGEIAQLVEDDE